MRFSPGETFGRYVIEALLGEGGMGEVYRAADTRLQRKVALKVVRQRKDVGEATWGTAVARMQREARAAAALSHPSTVAIYDVGEHEGTPFIAMELVLGRPLRALVGGDELSIATRLRILHDVARALGAAHREGFVHRDVKPENLMLRDDGAVKILDFGIARRLVAGDELEVTIGTGVPAGTPAYMAPEQVQGERVDARADQFAWGTVAYELLTGRLPFRADRGGMGLIASILSDKPAPLEGLPERVGAIVMRALEKRPDNRFATMDDLARELSEFVVGEAPEAPGSRRKASLAPGPRSGRTHPSQTTGARPSGQRRQWIPLAAVGLGLAGAALAAVAWRHRDLPPEVRPALPAEALKAVVPTAITELAQPRSQSPEALVAHREGLQAIRDGSWNTAAAAFDRARSADPTLATAHLRYALLVFERDLPRARDAYRQALASRAGVSERDQAFIDAFEPHLVREPPDSAEAARRLEVIAARFPGDAEIFFWQAWMIRLQNPEQFLPLVERCVELDPQYADCWQTKARALRVLGRIEEAGVALDRCFAISPGAVDCIRDRVDLEEAANRCDRAEDLARQWIAKDPTAGEAYARLGRQMFAQGRPTAAIGAAIEQAARRFRDAGQSFEAANIELLFAEATGDFAAAERIAQQVAASGDERTRPERPAYLALHRALLDLESGKPAEATRRARAFFAEGDILARIAETPCDGALMRLAALARGPGPAARVAYEKQRQAWLQSCEGARPARRGSSGWYVAHAQVAMTPEEAREALATLPSDEPPGGLPWQKRALGGVHWLAGDAKGALGHLAAGNAHCAGMAAPIEHLQNLYRLGAAREAVGEKEAACAAYGAVLDRWGATKESVTAREAARRAKALGCPARRGS